jgi:hypothetical protein
MACTIDDNSSGPNIVWSSQKCKNVIQEVLSERCLLKTPLYTVGNLVQFDNNGGIIDSQMRVDDDDQNPNVLWTSTKTGNAINNALSNLVQTTSSFVPNKFLTYNTNGVLQSSQYGVDDTAPSNTNLYTSQKWDTLLSNATSYTIPKFNNAKDGIVCLTKSDGTLDISGNYTINDTLTSSQNLWSSQKVKQYMDANVLGQCQDQINNVNTKIQVQNTAITSLQNQFSSKMDKITGVATNLAVFDGSGNLQDSGMYFNDSAPPSNKILWTSQKISGIIDDANAKADACAIVPASYVAGNIPNFSSNGTLQDSGYVIDDTRTGDKVLWSSQKQQSSWQAVNGVLQAQLASVANTCNDIKQSKMNKLINIQPNSLLKTDASGVIVSSGYTVDDNAAPNSNVLWTTNKYNSLNLAQFSSTPIASQNLVMYDSNGKISDSGVRIDDSCTTSQCLWTAQKINSILATPKFFVTGIFVGNLVFDNNMWYTPQFTVSDAVSQSYNGLNNIVVPSDGYYYVSVYGILTVTDKCEIQMQFKSGNMSNYALQAGAFNVSYASADKYSSAETISFQIKVMTPNVQASTSLQNPLKFYVNKI